MPRRALSNNTLDESLQIKTNPKKSRLINRSVVTDKLIQEKAKLWETRKSVVKLKVLKPLGHQKLPHSLNKSQKKYVNLEKFQTNNQRLLKKNLKIKQKQSNLHPRNQEWMLGIHQQEEHHRKKGECKFQCQITYLWWKRMVWLVLNREFYYILN